MEPYDFSNSDLSEKEQKILEAATKIFSEKGFSAATTSEIAKSAGIAEGTVFRYFKTKKDILRGILIRMISIISGKFVVQPIGKIFTESKDKDLRTVLKEIVYDRMKLVDSIFPMARVVLTEALFHEDVREAVYQNIIVKAVDMFSDFYKQMSEKGMLREDVDPVALVRNIVGNMFILIAQKKLFGDKFEMDDLGKEVDKMIDVIMYGIAKSTEL